MSNVFAAEQPIIDRIKAQVPTLAASVFSLSQLEAFESVPPVPAVVVRPMGSRVESAPADGAFQTEVQVWELALLVGHQQTDATVAQTTTQQGGALIFELLRALVGWRPAAGYMPMAYAGRAEPYYEPGYAEYPLSFETGLVITGLGN